MIQARFTPLAMFAVCAGCASHARAPSTSASLHTCFVMSGIDIGLDVRKGDACDERLPPASTFKVPHALIALEVGARTDANDSEVWDGTDYGGAAWNQDQTLRSALQHSTYWYFKRTALRVGLDRMQRSPSVCITATRASART